MFLAHSFRLRDPWLCEALEDGALRWSRVFHRPTGLDPGDQLVLVISGLPLSPQVTINGQLLAGGPEFHITHLLAETNKIELRTPSPTSSLQPPPSRFPYDARLAIFST
jgi:hypothetical protein